MRSLSDTAALIIDMWDNGGGHPASVAYLVSFFLDEGRRVHHAQLVDVSIRINEIPGA